MKKYRLLTSFSPSPFYKKGHIYNENESRVSYASTIGELALCFPDEWQEIKGEPIGYKFKDEFACQENIVEAAASVVDYNLTKGTFTQKRPLLLSDTNYKDVPFFIEKFKQAGVLDLWFDPIYDEGFKLPEIGGYKGEFVKNKIFGDSVRYGCHTIKVDLLADLLETSFESIKIEGVTVTREKIKQIVEYIETL